MFMEIARLVGKRSTCMRLNVGAIIVYDNRIISMGYNGTPPGTPHCTGNDCPGRNGCTLTLHAEANAVKYIPDSLKRPGLIKDMYTTDSPCPDCAIKIVEAGIKRVFYERQYRVTDALDGMINIGVSLILVTPAGCMIDYETKQVISET